uniref:(northern house mosquito) hypothetical protein n=1 Tax=Culex pipiens TaxID=7175 RepID=A0A8D8BM37_CULPI
MSSATSRVRIPVAGTSFSYKKRPAVPRARMRMQFSSGLFSVVHTGTGSAGSFQLYVKFSSRLVHFSRIDDLRIAGVFRDQQNIFPHSGHWRRTSARPRKLPARTFRNVRWPSKVRKMVKSGQKFRIF